MKLLTSTIAATAMLASGAIAETHMVDESMQMGEMQGDLIRSRDITGGTVYSMGTVVNDSWDSTMNYDAVDTNWNDIGEIEDLVLSKDGKITGIVAEIGGFLDIGDKHVVIAVSDMNLVAVDDQSYAYVTRLTEEQLEQLPGVDEGFWD